MSLVMLEPAASVLPAVQRVSGYTTKAHLSHQHPTGEQCPIQSSFRRNDTDVQETVVQPSAREQHEAAWKNPDISHHDGVGSSGQWLASVEAYLKLVGLALKARDARDRIANPSEMLL